MKELTIVRENLMTFDDYSPYCGNNISRYMKGGCSMPRTVFNGEQFYCLECGWVSKFPDDFIKQYKEKWNK